MPPPCCLPDAKSSMLLVTMSFVRRACSRIKLVAVVNSSACLMAVALGTTSCGTNALFSGSSVASAKGQRLRYIAANHLAMSDEYSTHVDIQEMVASPLVHAMLPSVLSPKKNLQLKSSKAAFREPSQPLRMRLTKSARSVSDN